MPRICPDHTHSAFQPKVLRLIVEWVSTKARQAGADAIAACGHSGLLVAGAVSHETGLNVIAVRKPGDTAIADSEKLNTYDNEYETKYDKYVIVDDLISSGSTVLNIIHKVAAYNVAKDPIPACVILYAFGEVADPEAHGTHRMSAALVDGLVEEFPLNDRLKRQDLKTVSRHFHREDLDVRKPYQPYKFWR